MNARVWWQLLKDAADGLLAARAFKMAAALSYYAALSLAPLLVIVPAVAGLLFDRATIETALTARLEVLTGREAAGFLHEFLSRPAQPSHGVIASLLAGGMLLFGAASVFAELRDDLNILWQAEKPEGRWPLEFLKHRLLSLAMVVGIGLLLLVALVVNSMLSMAAATLERVTGQRTLLQGLVHLIVALLNNTLFFALIYRVLPARRVRWRDVAIGALVTAALFLTGQLAISQYLAHAAVGSGYGAAGSFVVVLVWVYYSSLIVLFGASVTHQIAQRRR